MTAPRILVLGHSFIHRLQAFIVRSNLIPNNFSLDSAVIRLYGVGGRTVAKVVAYDLDVVRSFKPDIVILQLGTNDLVAQAPQTVGSSIEELVRLLHDDLGVQYIGVCQVLRRCPPPVRVTDFNTRVQKLHRYLQVVLGPLPFCFYWKHIGFWNPSSNLFLRDGVHLNDLGLFRFHRSLRGAVLKSLSLLRGL